MNLKTATINL